jgi:hypothetical protein
MALVVGAILAALSLDSAALWARAPVDFSTPNTVLAVEGHLSPDSYFSILRAICPNDFAILHIVPDGPQPSRNEDGASIYSSGPTVVPVDR